MKALLYRYFGEIPCIHGSRVLLARLRNLLMDAGRGDIASLINGFMVEYRDGLGILEESYIMARYGAISYGEKRVYYVSKLLGELSRC